MLHKVLNYVTRVSSCSVLSDRSIARKLKEKQKCHIPCPCEVTPWSPWGPCSTSCHKGPVSHGYQVRMREVIQAEDPGGVGCPALKDSRLCDTDSLPMCTRWVCYMAVIVNLTLLVTNELFQTLISSIIIVLRPLVDPVTSFMHILHGCLDNSTNSYHGF